LDLAGVEERVTNEAAADEGAAFHVHAFFCKQRTAVERGATPLEVDGRGRRGHAIRTHGQMPPRGRDVCLNEEVATVGQVQEACLSHHGTRSHLSAPKVVLTTPRRESAHNNGRASHFNTERGAQAELAPDLDGAADEGHVGGDRQAALTPDDGIWPDYGR